MSDNSVQALVNYSPPTDAPRAVHFLLATVTSADLETVISRVLHQQERVREVSTGFSRAHWVDCEIVFVPTVHSVGFALGVTASFVREDSAPPTPLHLWQQPDCRHFLSGGNSQTARVLTVPMVPSDSCTSTLVKPIPIEMERPAFSFTVSCHTDDENMTLPDTVCRVFLRGHLSLGGTA